MSEYVQHCEYISQNQTNITSFNNSSEKNCFQFGCWPQIFITLSQVYMYRQFLSLTVSMISTIDGYSGKKCIHLKTCDKRAKSNFFEYHPKICIAPIVDTHHNGFYHSYVRKQVFDLIFRIPFFLTLKNLRVLFVCS